MFLNGDTTYAMSSSVFVNLQFPVIPTPAINITTSLVGSCFFV